MNSKERDKMSIKSNLNLSRDKINQLTGHSRDVQVDKSF